MKRSKEVAEAIRRSQRVTKAFEMLAYTVGRYALLHLPSTPTKAPAPRVS